MAAKTFENPLIRNVRMREMYTTMVEARLLSRQMKKKHRGFVVGQEACWVATVIDLHEGDLTSDMGIGPLLGYARDAERSKAKVLAAAMGGTAGAGRLAVVPSTINRLWCAIGAALALRANEGNGVVLAYVGESELTTSEWTQVLKGVTELEAPVIFIVIPEQGDTGALARLASSLGVPGIPVDASDAIAIYRVAQESIVRARADGKPALIAGVPFSQEIRGVMKPVDPITLLGQQLVAKGVATAAWVAAVEPSFKRKLATAAART
jgi:TPP-dependent pyruvate/acetoin dehydrogenase alpha subunit